MILRRALVQFQHGVSTLVLDIASLTAFVAALAMAAPFLFILVAQFTRLGSTGDWRAIPLSEFFEIIRMDPPGEQAGQILGFILAFPATLSLFVATLAFWIIGRTMYRMKRREREKFHSSRQRQMISDIEREFEKAQSGAQRLVDRN